MEITIEKIDLVKDRTGCTYAEAKEALEQHDGSVVDAIIALEEKTNKDHDRITGESLKDSPIFLKMKEIVDKGNVSRIVVSKGDKTVVNFPVTAGVIGTLLVPWGAILGIVAAMGAQCSIDFIDEKGKAFDLDGKVIGFYDKAKGIVVKSVDKAQTAINDKESIDEIMNTIDSLAKKAGKTVKELIKDAADAYKTSDAEDIIEEEFKNEEEL
jgi:phosphate uptake regulator